MRGGFAVRNNTPGLAYINQLQLARRVSERSPMRRLSHADFVAEFPLTVPAFTIEGIDKSLIEIDRDTLLSGIHGPVTVRSGAKVSLQGIIEGPVIVEDGAVAYINAIISGDLTVHGAASVEGIVSGTLHGGDAATVAVNGIVANKKSAST
jgi:hypothetical protein